MGKKKMPGWAWCLVVLATVLAPVTLLLAFGAIVAAATLAGARSLISALITVACDVGGWEYPDWVER